MFFLFNWINIRHEREKEVSRRNIGRWWFSETKLQEKYSHHIDCKRESEKILVLFLRNSLLGEFCVKQKQVISVLCVNTHRSGVYISDKSPGSQAKHDLRNACLFNKVNVHLRWSHQKHVRSLRPVLWNSWKESIDFLLVTLKHSVLEVHHIYYASEDYMLHITWNKIQFTTRR